MDRQKKIAVIVIVFVVIILIVAMGGVYLYAKHRQQSRSKVQTTGIIQEPSYGKDSKVKKKREVDPEIAKNNWASTVERKKKREINQAKEKRKRDSIEKIRALENLKLKEQQIKDSLIRAEQEREQERERERIRRSQKRKIRQKPKTNHSKLASSQKKVVKQAQNPKEENLFQIEIENVNFEENTSQVQSNEQPKRIEKHVKLCSFFSSQYLKNNGSVKLRNIEPITLSSGVVLPSMTILMGYARVNGNRMSIHINQAISPNGYYNVDLIGVEKNTLLEGLSLGDEVEQGVNKAGDAVARDYISGNPQLQGFQNAAGKVLEGLTKQKNKSLFLEDGDEIYVKEKIN